jgi:ubiquitin carboxyl-terminal hydrolase 47
VQELCRVLFDALEKSFKGTKHEDFINNLYQGVMKDYVKCKECGQESKRTDFYLDIPLVLRAFGTTKSVGSIEEALTAFSQPETLEGDNQYNCEKCSKKVDALKGLALVKLPYLLTLQLKRFDFDYERVSTSPSCFPLLLSHPNSQLNRWRESSWMIE